MHTFFLLSALLLAAVVSSLGALLLRQTPGQGRRFLALVVLAAPLFALGLAVQHVGPRFWEDCAPLVGWDRLASMGLLAGLGGVALGSLALNVGRLVLVERLLRSCPPLESDPLLKRTRMLAGSLGLREPAMRLLRVDAPLALSGGLSQPTVVISQWFFQHLDATELDAVISHELAHLARRDYLTRAAGRFLRDATVYLPGGWYALRVLEADEELSADSLAVQVTARPLALASALGKVWHRAMASQRPACLAGAPTFGGNSATLLEQRLHRLLEEPRRSESAIRGRVVAGAAAVSVGEVVPRVLAASAAALPLVCALPRGFGL